MIHCLIGKGGKRLTEGSVEGMETRIRKVNNWLLRTQTLRKYTLRLEDAIQNLNFPLIWIFSETPGNVLKLTFPLSALRWCQEKVEVYPAARERFQVTKETPKVQSQKQRLFIDKLLSQKRSNQDQGLH